LDDDDCIADVVDEDSGDYYDGDDEDGDGNFAVMMFFVMRKFCKTRQSIIFLDDIE